MKTISVPLIMHLLLLCSISAVSALDCPPAKAPEEIVQDNDMSLANDGNAHVFLAFDTTDPQLLKLGIELGDALFELSGARFPIVDSRHAGGETRSIVLQRKMPSAIYVPKETSYEVEMLKHEPWSRECPKNLVIRFKKGHEREAVDAFLNSAFGVTLTTAAKEMEDKKPVQVLYLPAGFQPLPESLAEERKEKKEELLKKLKSQVLDESLDVRTRYLAILKLGQAMDLSATPLLISICEGDHKCIFKQYALRSIGYLRDPEAIPCLVRILSQDVTGDITDEGEDGSIIRRGAILALDNMKELPGSVIALLRKIEASDNEYPSVKEYATMIINKRKKEK